jgi:hypothetical protein
MPGKSDALETELLNAIYRSGTTLAGHTLTGKPANRYFALFSADPTDAGSGAELSGGGYARLAVPTADASWSAPADASGSQQITNAIVLTMTESTGSQGTATYFGMMTASTGGVLIHSGALSASLAITAANITAYFPIGSVAISEG